MASGDSYGSDMWFIADGEGAIKIPLNELDGTDRSTIGSYFHAIQDFMSGRDPAGDGIQAYEGYGIGPYEFETNLDVIEELARHGELDFPSIYE